MRRRRGSIVVVVLVLVALGSMLMVRLVEDNALELALAAREADRARLRTEAWSEMELALAVIAEVNRIDSSRLHVPAQGWGDPHAYAGIGVRPGLTITYTFEDESAKLPLATLSLPELTNLLEALGLSLSDAQSVADAIFAWTKPGHQPQDALASELAYERAALAYRPPARPLRSFEELRSVGVARAFLFDADGRPTQLLEDFRRCVSLYSFGGTNVNTCEPAVLRAKGFDDHMVEQVLAYRTDATRRPSGAAPYFSSMADLRSVSGNAGAGNGLGTTCRLLRVRVRLQEGRATHEVAALVTVSPTAAFPDAMADPEAAGDDTPETTTPKTGSGSGTPATGARQTAGTQGLTSGRAASGATNDADSVEYPFPILDWTERAGRTEMAEGEPPLNRFAIDALSDQSPLRPETLADPPNPRPTPSTSR